MYGIYIPHLLWYVLFLMILMIGHDVLPRFSLTSWRKCPCKIKFIKKPQIPYMNSKLRKAMHKRNMLRNKYKKGVVEWDIYRMQRNFTPSIYKKSQATYCSERCEGGAKNQKFWKTIKPFLTFKQPSNNNIILKEYDKISGRFVIILMIISLMWPWISVLR